MLTLPSFSGDGLLTGLDTLQDGIDRRLFPRTGRNSCSWCPGSRRSRRGIGREGQVPFRSEGTFRTFQNRLSASALDRIEYPRRTTGEGVEEGGAGSLSTGRTSRRANLDVQAGGCAGRRLHSSHASHLPWERVVVPDQDRRYPSFGRFSFGLAGTGRLWIKKGQTH